LREPTAVVYVVDDDESMRRAIDLLMESAGLKVQGFATAADFLAFNRAEIPACLILDVNLPDLNGLDLQNELSEARNPLPIIFITGCW
jgi:FixJ family two-component response regulator